MKYYHADDAMSLMPISADDALFSLISTLYLLIAVTSIYDFQIQIGYFAIMFAQHVFWCMILAALTLVQ